MNNQISDKDLARKAQTLLIKIAAEMATGKGLPSSFIEDHKLPKTTPVKTVRIVEKEFDKMDYAVKDWAHRISQIARSLTI